MVVLKGWRYAAFLCAMGGAVGLFLYPVAIHPMMHPEGYRKIQAQTRAGVRQEDIQPGNMDVWKDPFQRKKN